MKRLKPTVTVIATAKPTRRAIRERRARRGARCTIEVEMLTSGPNSGPTAMAPTMRTALSSTTPQAAIIVARVMKAR